MEQKRYDEEAARRILEQASALQLRDQTTTFSRDQLAEMAQELDIAPEYLQLAEKNWLDEQEKKHPKRAPVAVPPQTEVAVQHQEVCRGPSFTPIVPILFFFIVMGFFGGIGGDWFFGGPLTWILIPAFFFAFGNSRRRSRHLRH